MSERCQYGHKPKYEDDTEYKRGSLLIKHHFTKRFSCDESLSRQWRALYDCKGPLIQKAISLDQNLKTITYAYEPNAIPLSSFKKDQICLFSSLLPQIIIAIAHCHDKGWVHGDIKPSNILYLPDNDSIKLIDFGACQIIGTARKSLKKWQLTPKFASLQQLSGTGWVCENDDWHALNVLIEQTK